MPTEGRGGRGGGRERERERERERREKRAREREMVRFIRNYSGSIRLNQRYSPTWQLRSTGKQFSGVI